MVVLKTASRGVEKFGSGNLIYIHSRHISQIFINPMYSGGLCHCYIMGKSICHFRGVGSVICFYSRFLWKILLANNVDPDQTPHYVHCLPILPITLLWVSR